ncbi:MAG: hypothetical protein COV75_00555 [Candidatus Omnitrophica bacterium CG11_big_fil_rev_8_21_14_0_20_63_9]|nr:MAG: hypothetical protein COV75_00555 [Candidatus Omnitrophica bacterium CG11_big_fil_rev_8_21_14_0_20_63_9]
MKRLILGLAAGLMLGAMAYGQDDDALQSARLEEIAVGAGSRATFAVPPEYGRLADVAVNSGVHYLYFEDSQGVIRLVLIGPRGAVPRSRLDVQLLSPQVYVVERAAAPAS